MADFSTSEKKILKLIPPADPMRTCLANLREAVEKIWAVETPRIVQGFTDHGIAHYERLAGYSVEILNANTGKKLSAEEAFLLLAGIYIHDIGMQCDVVKFPKIKEQAEKLGASFDVKEFTAANANDYSHSEQMDIRKNHHILSIAWIDIARSEASTPLSSAANGIPSNLVSDLKDVAVHHTKFPISDCPIEFRLDPTGRKRFVAAILRFADELDIQNNRVIIETIDTFSFKRGNAVYWWLHQQTKITFPNKGFVRLLVTLHPDDHEEFSPIIQRLYIDEFRTKNLPVISTLNENLVSIFMDYESKVIDYEEAEKLPEEVQKTLREMGGETSVSPLLDLSTEIRLWLRAIKYEISDEKMVGSAVSEMTATISAGTIKQSVLVQSVARKIEVSDVELSLIHI